MDERGAKLQGLEIHRRDMAFVRGYVSCNSCGCNYNANIAQKREPTFCQIYCMPVDPMATDANILRGEACEQWVHYLLDRNMVVHPDHTYLYEKWQE